MVKLRIGITLGRPVEDLANLLWSSGINQNAALLMMLMRRLPDVAEVVAVDCSGKPAPHPLASWVGVPTIDPADAPGRLDVILETGGRASPVDMNRFRDAGGKLVSYMAGNAMAMNFEALASNLPHGEFMSETPFDAVWITPQHWHMNRDHCRITRSAKVHVTPHLWDPIFIDLLSREQSIDPFFQRNRPGRAESGWRIGVLEPNINVLKTFHLPLLVAEEAFRAAPDLIDRVLLFNTQHLTGIGHFDDLTTTTDLFKAGRLFAEGRHATPIALARHIDAVIVHQWENDLNYLYWDVLWSGHPLIHNSPSAAEVGYYYQSFDPVDGGRVLADALARHDAEADAYQARALDFVRGFSIDAPAVRAATRDLLEDLFA